MIFHETSGEVSEIIPFSYPFFRTFLFFLSLRCNIFYPVVISNPYCHTWQNLVGLLKMMGCLSLPLHPVLAYNQENPVKVIHLLTTSFHPCNQQMASITAYTTASSVVCAALMPKASIVRPDSALGKVLCFLSPR